MIITKLQYTHWVTILYSKQYELKIPAFNHISCLFRNQCAFLLIHSRDTMVFSGCWKQVVNRFPGSLIQFLSFNNNNRQKQPINHKYSTAATVISVCLPKDLTWNGLFYSNTKYSFLICSFLKMFQMCNKKNNIISSCGLSSFPTLLEKYR